MSGAREAQPSEGPQGPTLRDSVEADGATSAWERPLGGRGMSATPEAQARRARRCAIPSRPTAQHRHGNARSEAEV
jgi:hypothetical protein